MSLLAGCRIFCVVIARLDPPDQVFYGVLAAVDDPNRGCAMNHGLTGKGLDGIIGHVGQGE